jgi:hypothetical protein
MVWYYALNGEKNLPAGRSESLIPMRIHLGLLINSGTFIVIILHVELSVLITLSDDSCATLALLNVLLNCEDVQIGPTLDSFKEFTLQMDPVVSGCLPI